MKTMNLLLSIGICLNILCGCTGKSPNRQTKKGDLPRIVCLSIDVTENYAQTYGGSFCQSTSAQIDGKDCFIGYNRHLHCIDIINLTDRKPLKQIPLKYQGPDGIPDVLGMHYYQNTFVIKSSFGFCRIDDKGSILSKWSLSNFFEKEAKDYTFIMPGSEIIIMNVYSFMFFDEREGIVAFPIYKDEKNGNGVFEKEILLFSCKDWSIVDRIDISYPTNLQGRKNLDVLGSINVLPHGNLVIYNFPASSEVFVYNRTTQTTRSYDIPSSYAKSIYEGGLTSGFYRPLVYDVHRNTFWRVQDRPFSSGRGVAGKPFSISQISSNFELLGEYSILEEEHSGLIDTNPIFTNDVILFTYNGGEYIGLNNMAFYVLKLE